MFIADVEKALCDLVNLSQQVSIMVLTHRKCVDAMACKVHALCPVVAGQHITCNVFGFSIDCLVFVVICGLKKKFVCLPALNEI